MSLLELCADLPVRSFAAGDVLLAEGAPPGAVLVLRTGEVEIRTGGTPLTRVGTPGAVLGETSVLLGRATTAAVVAVDDVEVHVVEDLDEAGQAQPELLVEVARVLARRVTALTRYLADLREQYAEVGGHLGMMDQVLSALLVHDGAETDAGSDRDDVPPL